MKYHIYRINIIGNKAFAVQVEVDDIEVFRKETAQTFKVPTSKVKFHYDKDESYTYKHKYVKG